MNDDDFATGPFSDDLRRDMNNDDKEYDGVFSPLEGYREVLLNNPEVLLEKIPEFHSTVDKVLSAYLFDVKTIDTSKLQNTSKFKLRKAIMLLIDKMGDQLLVQTGYKRSEGKPSNEDQIPTVREALLGLHLSINVRRSDKRF